MKTITTLFFTMLTVLNCSNCNSQLINQDFAKSEISIKDNYMDTIKKIDIERYKMNSPDGSSYSFSDSDGNSVIYFQTDDLYVEHIQKPEEVFYQNNEYFKKSGVIKRTGLCQKNGGMQYGVWKIYDETGSLLQEIDYERPYKFGWEKVVEFLKKEKVDFEDPSTFINRVNRTIDGKYWSITWDTKQNINKPVRTVHLDGDSGRIIFDEFNEGMEI